MGKEKMPLKVAKEFLAGCTAHTCLFAQGTLSWKKEDREVAFGAFTEQRTFVRVEGTKKYARTDFEGEDALALKDLGVLQPEILEGVTCGRKTLVIPNPKRP